MANITTGARLAFASDFGNVVASWPVAAKTTMYNGGTRVYNGEVTGYEAAVYVRNSFTATGVTSDLVDYTVKYYGFSGTYKVSGLVEINTVVVSGKWVYIFPEAAPSVCIGAQYTDTNGVFSFNNIAPGRYKVYAMDPNFNYNGKLYENIIAVSM